MYGDGDYSGHYNNYSGTHPPVSTSAHHGLHGNMSNLTGPLASGNNTHQPVQDRIAEGAPSSSGFSPSTYASGYTPVASIMPLQRTTPTGAIPTGTIPAIHPIPPSTTSGLHENTALYECLAEIKEMKASLADLKSMKAMMANFVQRDELTAILRAEVATDLPGMIRQRNEAEVADFIEKNKSIPDVKTMVRYHDLPRKCMSKLMQFTNFFHQANTTTGPTWLLQDDYVLLRRIFTAHTVPFSNVSGLAVYLFADTESKPKAAFASPLGRIHIALNAQVSLNIFRETRETLFTTLYYPTPGTAPIKIKPKHGRPDKPAPRYMSSELAKLLVPNSIDDDLRELTSTQHVVHNFIMSSRNTIGSSYLGKRSRNNSTSSGNSSPSDTSLASSDSVSSSLTPNDVSHLRKKTTVIRFHNSQSRDHMNKGRNNGRKYIYRCYLRNSTDIQRYRKIRAHDAESIHFKDAGVYFEWHNCQDIDPKSIPTDLSNPSAWKIPLAKTSGGDEADAFNKAAFETLHTSFPSMFCTVHWRCVVRPPPSTSPAELAAYNEEARRAPGGVLYEPRSNKISF